jgi:hypothetical protein
MNFHDTHTSMTRLRSMTLAISIATCALIAQSCNGAVISLISPTSWFAQSRIWSVEESVKPLRMCAYGYIIDMNVAPVSIRCAAFTALNNTRDFQHKP